MENNHSKNFIIFAENDGCLTSKPKHLQSEEALNEAKRLALKEKDLGFYVYQLVAVVKPKTEATITNIARDKVFDDNIASKLPVCTLEPQND